MPLEVRQDWLAQVEEDVIEPGRRIIDPHHHFFVPGGPFPAYDLNDLWADTTTHGVEKTVFMQCWEGYRDSGPEDMQCVGETEWVDAIAKEAAKSPDSAQIAGIIGTVDFRLGDGVRSVLDAHLAASGLFRGIRQCAAWDSDPDIMAMPTIENASLYDEPNFRAGFEIFAGMDLVLDAYHYHHQTPSFTKLAQDYPNVRMVLDHLGTPLGVGPYADQRDHIFGQWQADIAAIAECPNVHMKLGGLAMPWNGFGYDDDPTPPSSDRMVEEQTPYYQFAIEQFGAQRCMFESNFPVDKCAVSYTVLWNAFKKMAASYSESEKHDMFYGTAERVYRL